MHSTVVVSLPDLFFKVCLELVCWHDLFLILCLLLCSSIIFSFPRRSFSLRTLFFAFCHSYERRLHPITRLMRKDLEKLSLSGSMLLQQEVSAEKMRASSESVTMDSAAHLSPHLLPLQK